MARDGTAEPVSRHQILSRERVKGREHFPCSADHEHDWQLYTAYTAVNAIGAQLRDAINSVTDEMGVDGPSWTGPMACGGLKLKNVHRRGTREESRK